MTRLFLTRDQEDVRGAGRLVAMPEAPPLSPALGLSTKGGG